MNDPKEAMETKCRPTWLDNTSQRVNDQVGVVGEML